MAYKATQDPRTDVRERSYLPELIRGLAITTRHFLRNLFDGLVALRWELFEKSCGLFPSKFFQMVEVWDRVPLILQGVKHLIVYLGSKNLLRH